jgi:hypothetical protein
MEKRYCNNCHDKFTCSECGFFDMRLRPGGRCVNCADKEIEEKRKTAEGWAADEIPIDGSVIITSTPERPFRTVSVETELDGDGALLARVLYRCGMVPIPEVASYGSNPEKDAAYPAFLKHDGSVTAGELIMFRMQLDDPKHAAAFVDILSKARSLEKIGKVKRNANAGGHIHIDAHNFTFADAWRLVMIWNYLEDVIYRLAGSTCDYGHRSLVSGHDRANGGEGYAHGIIKGPFGTKGNFGSQIKAQQRMSGLNFQHFFRAMGNCGCGAMAYEDSKRCKCNLGKSTIEWRVWNSCLNPRVLHGQIALMQAMHAFADGGENGVDPTPEDEAKFPALAWNKRAWGACSERHKREVKERLTWMFRYLPLTRGERDSLVYAFKQSELKGLGDQFLDGLMEVEAVNELQEKKLIVRNPSRRKREIKIEPPAPGVIKPRPIGIQPARGQGDLWEAAVDDMPDPDGVEAAFHRAYNQVRGIRPPRPVRIPRAR